MASESWKNIAMRLFSHFNFSEMIIILIKDLINLLQTYDENMEVKRSNLSEICPSVISIGVVKNLKIDHDKEVLTL